MKEWEELELSQRGKLKIIPQRAKLLADENIPSLIIEELRNGGVSVQSGLDIGIKGRADEDVLTIAQKKNLILLTTDKDFWDERKHPISRCFGVICVDYGPQDWNNIYRQSSVF